MNNSDIKPLTKESQLGKGSKKKRSSYKKLKDKAWSWTSKYIRLRDSDEDGICECISCGKRGFWEKNGFQAGHFIPKSQGNYFYFLWININAQCYNCNYYGSNHTGAIYAENLKKKIGKEKVNELLKLGQQRLEVKNFTEDELICVIEYCKEQIDILLKAKNF